MPDFIELTALAARLRKPASTTEVHFDPAEPFFFALVKEEGVCAVTVMTQKGKPALPDPGCFSGTLRQALQEFHLARQAEMMRFNWETTLDTDCVRLESHPSLLRALLAVPNLLGLDGKAIKTEPLVGRLVLVLEDKNDGHIACHWEWRERTGHRKLGSEMQFLSEDAVVSEGVILRIEPLGPQFGAVADFPATVSRTRLPVALSLLLTACPMMEIEWDGYEFQTVVPVELRPTAIFRSVDEEGVLVLETGVSLPDYDADFLRQYEVSRVVRVDDMERRVTVAEVDTSRSVLALQNLRLNFSRLSRKMRETDAYWRELESGQHLLGPGLAHVFLRDHLGGLATDFTLYGAEKLRAYRVVYRRPQLHLSLGRGIDYFEGEATLDFEGESMPLWEALSHYKKNRLIPLSDGNQAVVDSAYMARLERLLKKSQRGVKVSFFDLPLVEELLGEKEQAELPATRDFFRGMASLDKRVVKVPNFRGKLRGYQKDGLHWLDYLHEHGLGGCLADEMGLGKTVQAIALLTKICAKAKTPSLVVMPRSLLFNWARELTTFAPSLRFFTYHQSARDWAAAIGHDIILTTYGTLRADIETISAVKFHTVVLDESQAIKNSDTQTARAACMLQAHFRLALSGTPVENHLGELHALFRFLNPGMFPVKAEFDREYVQPVEQEGDQAAATELRRKIYPFFLRRLKKDVLTELPPKIEQTLLVEMTPEQAALYHERREFFQNWVSGEIASKGLQRSQFVILEALLELRQLATVPESKTDGAVRSAKRDRLAEAMEEVISNGRKCLVFSNFLAGVEQVSELLQEMNVRHVSMTGITANRQELVESFQHDPHVKVFVMTLKTGGVGLNLTAADTVFLLDPWWNTAAEIQAIDRTHRIGQKNTVFTYRLIAKGTIEEKILELQERKRALVESVMTADASALKHLSEEEITELFHI